MEIHHVTLEECHRASGVVVVIDVLRAFTTAAFAFEAGAAQILMAETVSEALELSERFPGALLLGEVDGLPIPGFDFGNSPSRLAGVDLTGKTLIQRTSAGVQGVVRSRNADHLFAASFVTAQATVEALKRLLPPAVTFVITGVLGERDGDEDLACAEYMARLLAGDRPDPEPYLERVALSYSGRLFSGDVHSDFPAADLACAMQLDRFPRALEVHRRDGLLVLTPQGSFG